MQLANTFQRALSKWCGCKIKRAMLGGDWFEAVFGFPEHGESKTGTSFADARRRFVVTGNSNATTLVSKANKRNFHVGRFECPNIPELHAMCPSRVDGGLLTVSHVVSAVGTLIRDPGNAGAVFQVASQFNCLEMAGPHLTPEDGVTMYVIVCIRHHTALLSRTNAGLFFLADTRATARKVPNVHWPVPLPRCTEITLSVPSPLCAIVP
jgi:hypothetical protein